MSNDRFEKVSALMDGAAEGQQAEGMIGAVLNDPELTAAWTRYHLIGDGLRGALPDRYDLRFAERVSAMVEQEPTILAPSSARKPRVAKRYAAWAVAASLAGLGVIAAQTWRQYLPSLSGQGAAASLIGEIEPLPIATQRWREERAVPASSLSRYLVNHSRINDDMELEGVMPYVRLVGYEGDQ